MYAVIKTGGKQLKVQEQDIVAVERIEGEVGAKITFDEVLAKGEGADLTVGTPPKSKLRSWNSSAVRS